MRASKKVLRISEVLMTYVCDVAPALLYNAYLVQEGNGSRILSTRNAFVEHKLANTEWIHNVRSFSQQLYFLNCAHEVYESDNKFCQLKKLT